MTAPAPAAPAPRSRRWLLFVVVPVLGLVLLAAGAGAIYAGFVRGLERPVTDEDRGVLVKLADLKPWLERVPSGTERFRHARLIGSREVLYEFKTPPDSANGLFINCTVTIENSVASAEMGYRVMSTGVALGLKVAGGNTRLETAREAFRWGDESSSSIMVGSHGPVGNVFAARKGERLFSLVMAGMVVFEKGLPPELLQPVLTRLESYTPR